MLEPGLDARGERTPVEVAIVHAAGIISCVAVAQDEASLHRALSAYIREQAPFQLAHVDAREVNALLDRGRNAQAVEHYFSRVDGRWDPEQLTRVRLPLSEAVKLSPTAEVRSS